MSPITLAFKVAGYFRGKRVAVEEMKFSLYCAHIASGKTVEQAIMAVKPSLETWRNSLSDATVRALEVEANEDWDKAPGGG